MKSALVTGGTSGIGKAFSELLRKKGYEVAALGRGDADLSKESSACIDLLHSKKPSLIVNAAGFGIYGDAVTISKEKLDEMISVNCRALMQITLEAANLLIKEKRSGTILNVSSLSGHFPTPGMAVYGATKAFVTSFSEALDFELRGRGVRVLVSCPGMVATNFATRASGKLVKIKGQMSPTYVAHRMWRQFERGIGRDTFPKFHFFPNCLVKWMVYRSIQKRL